ncbi:MAG: hypothetical protein AAF798_14715 [Bacteroidota bacterium]
MKTTILFLLGLVTGSVLPAQQAQPVQFATSMDQQLYEATQQLLNIYQKHYQAAAAATTDMQPIIDLFQYSFVQTDTLASQYLQYKSAVARKETGLQFHSSFTSQSVQNQAKEALHTIGTGPMARVGVEWNMLESGLLKSSANKRIAEVDWQIFELTRQHEAQADNYAYQYNYIIQQFNHSKVELLQQRSAFLELALTIVEQLYLTHQLSYQEVLEYRRKLEESKVLAKAYAKYNSTPVPTSDSAPPTWNAQTLPVLSIKLTNLLQEEAQEAEMHTLRQLQKEKVDLLQNPALNWRLNTRFSYNFQFDNAAPTEGFPTLGIAFSMPIRFNKQDRAALAQIEKAQIDQATATHLYNNKKELLNLYQEYNYTLKQYIRFLHQQEELEEKIRIERALLGHHSTPTSPMPLLQYYDVSLETTLELIDLKQQLYLRLLKMYTLQPKVDLASVLASIPTQHIERKLAGKRLLLFVESDVHRLGSSSYYVEYLKKNELETILLPADADPSWLTYFQTRGFEVWTEQALSMATGTYRFKNHHIVLSANDKARPTSHTYAMVKTDGFQVRYELEKWMHEQCYQFKTTHFLFVGIASLHQMENQLLDLQANNY